MDKEISLGVDKEKSLKWNMNNSPKTNKEKSSKTSKEKSLETLWQEVQALDSSPRRPSSLSTQVYISLTNAMQYMKVAPSSGIYPIVYSSKQEYNISYQSSGPDFSVGKLFIVTVIIIIIIIMIILIMNIRFWCLQVGNLQAVLLLVSSLRMSVPVPGLTRNLTILPL